MQKWKNGKMEISENGNLVPHFIANQGPAALLPCCLAALLPCYPMTIKRCYWLLLGSANPQDY
jgi:hypothetical protein